MAAGKRWKSECGKNRKGGSGGEGDAGGLYRTPKAMGGEYYMKERNCSGVEGPLVRKRLSFDFLR